MSDNENTEEELRRVLRVYHFLKSNVAVISYFILAAALVLALWQVREIQRQHEESLIDQQIAICESSNQVRGAVRALVEIVLSQGEDADESQEDHEDSQRLRESFRRIIGPDGALADKDCESLSEPDDDIEVTPGSTTLTTPEPTEEG